MHPEDLMNPDLPSEIPGAGQRLLIFITLLLILMAALTQTAALP